MKGITFEQLVGRYQGSGEVFYEITDKEQAISDLNSRTSCCWGTGPIEKTGWVRLAAPAARSVGDVRTIFVCKASLVWNELERLSYRNAKRIGDLHEFLQHEGGEK